MRDYTKTRQRYLRDPLPTRLGGVAANLARLTYSPCLLQINKLVVASAPGQHSGKGRANSQ